MNGKINIHNYQTWSLSEKLYFFDSEQYMLIESWDELKLISFLKFFILNQDENKYIIKKALSLFVDFSLLGKIPNRKVLNLLIDETNSIEDTFVQIERLKSLLLFYELEPTSIINEFEKNINNNEAELKSESLYSLGLIYFLDAVNENNEEEFKKKIERSITFFKESFLCIENRIDSHFFQLVAELLQQTRLNPLFASENYLNNITQILWKYRLFSFDDRFLNLKVKVYRIIFNLLQITKQKPSEWLQYKNEFKKLCLAFYELQNCEIKERLSQNGLIEALKNSLIKNNLEPYFTLNFNAQKLKIEQYLLLPEISKEEKNILHYVLSLINNKNVILKESILLTKKKLETTFPKINEQRINEVLKVDSIENLQVFTLNVFDEFGTFSFENIYDSFLASLINLQGDVLYRDKSEDERNTYVRNMLSMAGFQIKDQTLWGSSDTGKSAGEVDVMVLNNNRLPFSIIEALILDSLNQKYLKQHIDKIYKYDTTGLKNNVLLIYSEAKDFSKFCDRYFAYISTYNYPHKLLSYEKKDSGYSEIKICKTTLTRNGVPTNLYHVILNLVK